MSHIVSSFLQNYGLFFFICFLPFEARWDFAPGARRRTGLLLRKKRPPTADSRRTVPRSGQVIAIGEQLRLNALEAPQRVGTQQMNLWYFDVVCLKRVMWEQYGQNISDILWYYDIFVWCWFDYDFTWDFNYHVWRDLIWMACIPYGVFFLFDCSFGWIISLLREMAGRKCLDADVMPDNCRRFMCFMRMGWRWSLSQGHWTY